MRRVTVNGVDWRLREDVADFLLDADALDVWKLVEHPAAVLVKKGVHRMVFRVTLDRGTPEGTRTLDLHVKVFLLPRVRDLLRYVVRESHSRREWRAAEALEALGIPTARCLAAGERRTAGVLRDDVLITETVETVRPLDRFVRDELPVMSSDERGRRVRAGAPVLAAFVRRLHDGGIRHDDFHAGNVLLRDVTEGARQLMLIDLHAVRRGLPLAVGALLDNLTRFNRFFFMHVSRTDRLRFWNAYVRGVPFLERHRLEYARLLEAHTRRSCEAFWRKRERRCLGTNREFRRLRHAGVTAHTVRGHIERSPYVFQQLPRRGMDMPDALVIKDSTTTRLWEQRIDFGSITRTVIVKRKERRGRGPWRLLRTFLRHVGARHEWRMAWALRLRGLPAVEMLAAFERRRLGLLTESVLVMSKVENATNLALYVREAFRGELTCEQARLRRRLARKLGRLVARLHRFGFTQRDLKPSNVLVSPADGPVPDAHRDADGRGDGFRLTLIDFEGMRHRSRVVERRRVRDLATLGAKFVDEPAVRRVDMMRFLDEYVIASGMCGARRDAFVRAVVRGVAERVRR
ncbi:MAG TPA: lipopolysaccharide kinase InaA family protein [Planctomycetota bacterium]|nr:lipopolysaccharide kinase InaA family protein [Planctomycetota bacterium]